MLTSDLVRPRIRRRGVNIHIELLNVNERHWQQTAADMLQLFSKFVGKPYRDWQTALDQFEGERMDYIVVRGLAKVIEDAAIFTTIETARSPVEVREKLFARGPVFSTPDLFTPHTRADVMRETAKSLRMSVKALELSLYADRLMERILQDVGITWMPEGLLARYNLELARGVLYDASEMRIEIYDNYKDFWRYLKLFKLMFEASRMPDGGYHVRLDGPISPFVGATRRYGHQFAGFLPALFLGERWQMEADIRHSHIDEPALYKLDYNSPLTSHFKRSGLFDSRLEEDFAAEFAEKFGDARDGWQLAREDEVLMVADSVFIPDFSMTHKKDGRRALVELVGFWHPDYLRRKIAKVRKAGLQNLVMLVRESVNLTPDKLTDIPGEVIYFPKKPVLKEVMAAVEKCAIT